MPTHPLGTTYTDTWTFDLDGSEDTMQFTSTFTAASPNTEWQSSTSFDPTDYIISTPKLKDTYFKGDTIYMPIFVREPYSTTNVTLKRMEYRIMLTGKDVEEVPFSDWQDVSYTDSNNFFILDTSWFVSDYEYRIEFKYYDSGSYIYHKPDYATFKVLA